MTERTIKNVAMAMAGRYYEERRSDRFRRGEDLVKVYRPVREQDGQLRQQAVMAPFKMAFPNAYVFAKSYWPVFYAAARVSLAKMLGMPHVTDYMKQKIQDALIEDREKDLIAQMRGQSKHLMQIAPNDVTGMNPEDIISKANLK